MSAASSRAARACAALSHPARLYIFMGLAAGVPESHRAIARRFGIGVPRVSWHRGELMGAGLIDGEGSLTARGVAAFRSVLSTGPGWPEWLVAVALARPRAHEPRPAPAPARPRGRPPRPRPVAVAVAVAPRAPAPGAYDGRAAALRQMERACQLLVDYRDGRAGPAEVDEAERLAREALRKVRGPGAA
jgi:hypothetical protein